jgi:ABC-type sugar transport system ATPase subunit
MPEQAQGELRTHWSQAEHTATASTPLPLLEALNIRKAFPGTQALDGVSFDLLPGEVHALVGENGAGKSTLVNILSGVIRPDAGEIRIVGRPVHIANPRQAQELGIGTVFQELSVVPALSVAENIFANRAPTRTLLDLIDWPALYVNTRALLDPFEADIDPRTLVRNLNISARQIVEIAKALSLNARILILDEPTTALTPDEVQLLFRVIRRLRAAGLGIVFISHRMQEVLDIADRVTVLRDGRLVGTYPASQLTVDDLIRLMVGRELSAMFDRHDSKAAEGAGAPLLRVQGLSGSGFQDVSFVLRRGEIVGLAGLKGAGRSELARALVGAQPVQAGELWVDGRRVAIHSPMDAAVLGIGYLPADRKSEGLFLDMTVRDNVAAASLSRLSRFGLVDTRRAELMAQNFVHRLAIHTPGVYQVVRRLSGGNQQKVMLARWLARQPKILIVDEPTRGIDVGTRAEIHHLLRELADQGVGIIVISSDLTELLGLSDRILVMREGRITGQLDAAEADEQKVMALAARHDEQDEHGTYSAQAGNHR